MTQRTFFLTAAAVFSLIALGRAIRLLFGWHVMVENVVVPVWISWMLSRAILPTRASGWADVYEVS